MTNEKIFKYCYCSQLFKPSRSRYGCELDVDREELVAKEDYILVQTMLAIYAWIEFEEDER